MEIIKCDKCGKEIEKLFSKSSYWDKFKSFCHECRDEIKEAERIRIKELVEVLEKERQWLLKKKGW